MPKFYGPFSVSPLPCSPNTGTLFNPNGLTWKAKYAFKIEIKNLELSGNIFNSTGYLKENKILCENHPGGQSPGGTGYLQNWSIRINTSNQLQFRYWFWDSGTDRWFWSTASSAVNVHSGTSNWKPNGSNSNAVPAYYTLGLSVTKGHRYDFTVTRPSNKSFTFNLKDLDTGGIQTFNWDATAWNNNYAGKYLIVGSTGISFDSAVFSGYPYNSDCLHTITITMGGKTSTTINVPITSDCGFSQTLSYDSPYIHKLNIVIPDVGGLSSLISSGGITWSDSLAYNSGTKTWSKYYTQDEPLDFPNIAEKVNYVGINNGSSDTGYNSLANLMFLGYSTSSGGALTHNDWDSYYMGTSDITLYPRIAMFGDLAATTGKGINDVNSAASSAGVNIYIKPAAANGTLKTVAASDLKIWSGGYAATSAAPSSVSIGTVTNIVTNTSSGGTSYKILPTQTTNGRYIYKVIICSDRSKSSAANITEWKSQKAYYKMGYGVLTLQTQDIPIPTKKDQLYYNGSNQTQTFNNYNTEYMTAQYITNKNAGTYTAIFTLKDSSKTRWTDGTTTQKTVTWNILPKEVTPNWGTRSWVFDGNNHATTCTLSGVVSGDSCAANLSGNSILTPGTKTVTITGLTNSNYTITSNKTTTIEVTKRPVTIRWGNTVKNFDNAKLTPTTSVVGTISGYAATSTGTQSSSANAAYYTSTASLTTGGDYYYINSGQEQQLEIKPRPVNITWNPISKVYDGTKLTSIPTITNLVSGTTCNMTIVHNVIGPAVDIDIAQVTALSNTNYTLEGSTGLTQIIMIKDVEDIQHGKVYEYDPSKTGEGVAPLNHWILVV